MKSDAVPDNPMKKQIEPTTAVVPCPVVLLSVGNGTDANVLTVSWIANVCSDPPTVAVGIRPTRYSHTLLKQSNDFVLNIPSVNMIEAVVRCGSVSGREHDKFAECSLTATPSSAVRSPAIQECPIHIECKVRNVIPLGSHDLFLGGVVSVSVDPDVLDSNGRLDVSAASLLTYVPLAGEYWSLRGRVR